MRRWTHLQQSNQRASDLSFSLEHTCNVVSLWRHQMETLSALLAFCARNSPVTGEFPAHRPVTRTFDDFFDLRLNQQLSKQRRRRWFETPSLSLWHHCNGLHIDTWAKLWTSKCIIWIKYHHIFIHFYNLQFTRSQHCDKALPKPMVVHWSMCRISAEKKVLLFFS